MSVRKAPSAKYSALSSACASTFSQLVMVPCETIKVQLQLFQKVSVKGESVLGKSIKAIYRTEGIRGFWRGYFVSLSCSIPSCAIYYSTFETLRRYAYNYCENHPTWIPFVPAITSSCAQVVTCLATSPIDRIRTQYWANRSQPLRLLLHNTMEEARMHGFTSLYHGLRPLLLRDICFSSVYWSVYEHLRNATASLNISPVLQNLVAASMGGIMTSAAVTPFDLVKTRQQVLRTREPILQSLRMIEKEEGIRGLFRGLTPRVVQTIPSMSVMMIVYDGLNRLILQRQTSVVAELLFLSLTKRFVEKNPHIDASLLLEQTTHGRGGSIFSVALHLRQTKLCDRSARSRISFSGVSMDPIAPGVGIANILIIA